ncbi:hypothetical protein HLB03_06185, partial [Acidianus sp. DSM 29099]|nr:hypothetical protein [Acidianus sp. RZ1]
HIYSFRYGIAISLMDDFIAFVKIKALRNQSEIIPVLDIGLYLREYG